MKKRILGILLTTLLISQFMGTFCTASAWYRTTMYAADGREILVRSDEVEAYKNVGWYTKPPVLMYAVDGRTLYVSGDEVELYKEVGWYTQPPVLMYAADGRTLYVSGDEVSIYQELGWYLEPMCTVYAPYDAVLAIPKRELQAYLDVGWYTTYDEAFYNQVIPDIQKLMRQKDYEAVINECEFALYMFEEYNAFYQDIEGRAYIAMDAWREKVKKPLVVLDSWTYTSDGTKRAAISFRNISHKAIVAVELEFNCYNVFMDPVKYYGSGSSLFKANIMNEWLYSNEKETYYWNLYGYSSAEHIKNIKIKRVAFSDGTVWSA